MPLSHTDLVVLLPSAAVAAAAPTAKKEGQGASAAPRCHLLTLVPMQLEQRGEPGREQEGGEADEEPAVPCLWVRIAQLHQSIDRCRCIHPSFFFLTYHRVRWARRTATAAHWAAASWAK